METPTNQTQKEVFEALAGLFDPAHDDEVDAVKEANIIAAIRKYVEKWEADNREELYAYNWDELLKDAMTPEGAIEPNHGFAMAHKYWAS